MAAYYVNIFLAIVFYMYHNYPFWPLLKVRILLDFTHAKVVRKADYSTYKRKHQEAAIMKEVH